MKKKKCVWCKSKYVKVIYLGLPMLLCTNSECNTVDGFFAPALDWIDLVFPFNGKFMTYKGNYLKALWIWLFII